MLREIACCVRCAVEENLDASGRAAPLLGYIQFEGIADLEKSGNPPIFLGWVRTWAGEVVSFSVKQHDDVCILLDGAGIAEVTHVGALVIAGFDQPVELAKRKHRNIQIFRK